jgi:hypothetical protein
MATYSNNFVGPLQLGETKLSNPLLNLNFSSPAAGNSANVVRPGGPVAGSISGTRDYRSANFGQTVPYPTVAGASTTQPMATAQYASPIGPQLNPVTASSGAGGGITGNDVSSDPGSQPDLTAELDAIFNPALSSLQGQESTLNQNYAGAQQDIQEQGALSQQTLADQQAAGVRDINQTGAEAGARKEDALTSATRLYNELQRGGQQRFGGASSAGEAYQTLTATEQQRRQGTIQNAYETAMQQVGTFKANLTDKYNTAVKEVELQKTEALRGAQQDFRNAMDQITAARNQLGSDRATASLNILQDLRNKVYTINQQALSFTQQMALNNQKTQAQVDAATKNFLQQVQGGQTALSSNPLSSSLQSPTTNYGVSSPQTSTNAITQTGRTVASKPYDPSDPSTWA